MFISHVLAGFESGNPTGAVLCDLSKAFDCVDRNILLHKLDFYGIIGNQNSLLKSYLSDRLQKVLSNNSFSNVTEVKYGVPQGSVLGPLLFLIAINDLSSNVECKSILFADDVTFLTKNVVLTEIPVAANNILNQANEWYKANMLLMNREKTQTAVFTLTNTGNLENEFSQCVKLLGMHIDSKLTWHEHVKHLCKSLHRIICLVRKLKVCISPDCLRMVYFSLFQSRIAYGLMFWGNSSSISSVLVAQKKMLRIITNSDTNTHCKPIFSQEKIQTVINLYIFACLLHTKKHLNTLILHRHVHNHGTRGQNKICRPYTRLTKVLTSFEATGIDLFNCLPFSAQHVSIGSFKKVIYAWLIVRPFYSLKEYFEADFSSINFA